MLPFSFCYAPVVASAMIATLLDGIPAVSVPYHRLQYDRTLARMKSGEVTADPNDLNALLLGDADIKLLDHHRDRLVELGALRRTEFVFKNVDTPTERSKVILRELMDKKCPAFIDFSSVHPPAPVPLRITIWYEPETAKAWAKYIAERDVKK